MYFPEDTLLAATGSIASKPNTQAPETLQKASNSSFVSKCSCSSQCCHGPFRNICLDVAGPADSQTNGFEFYAPDEKAATDVEYLHELVKRECAALDKNWQGSIILQCNPMTELDGREKAMEEPSEIDVCSYFDGQKAKYCRLNFSLSDFPPPSDLNEAFSDKNETWTKLKKYIRLQSYKSESPVVCSGSSCRGQGKKFVCQTCNSTNKKKREVKRLDQDYRSTHLVNDGERGERNNGRALPRRTSSQDPAASDCLHGFSVKCDDIGYHITTKYNGGCSIHSGHPKFDSSIVPLPLSLMTEEEIKELKHLHDTNVGEGVCSAYLFSKSGKMVPRGKISYLLDTDAENKEEFATDIDSMLRQFEKDEKVSHSVLWDIPSAGGTASENDHKTRLVTQSKCAGDPATIVKDLTGVPGMSEVAKMVEEDRKERNISPKKNVFLAVMWTEKENIRYFKMYPETVFVDVTSHSNNKKYSLLTFSCKSAVNKHVVFLKAWIPNQKRFSFRWVFKYAIESLGLDKYFQYTELFMKDGDPQQHNEIKRLPYIC